MRLDLYQIAHVLRDRFGWIWEIIERVNSWLFGLRYGRRLRGFKFNTLPEGYYVVEIKDVPVVELLEFFEHQPEEAFIYFRPHGFDNVNLKRLQRNMSFLAYILKDSKNGKIAGYFFNRSFFHGKGFRGRMVDVDYRGRGLGTAMNKMLNELGFGIGLRLFETVSKDNVASYRSALSASNVRVVKEMENNELYLEILKNK